MKAPRMTASGRSRFYHLLLRGFASVKELTGDDADSPIVERRTQSLIGVGLAYRF